MLDGLLVCRLSVGDERQQDEHEEGARWNENGLTNDQKFWSTHWNNTRYTWKDKWVQNVRVVTEFENRGWYKTWRHHMDPAVDDGFVMTVEQKLEQHLGVYLVD